MELFKPLSFQGVFVLLLLNFFNLCSFIRVQKQEASRQLATGRRGL